MTGWSHCRNCSYSVLLFHVPVGHSGLGSGTASSVPAHGLSGFVTHRYPSCGAASVSSRVVWVLLGLRVAFLGMSSLLGRVSKASCLMVTVLSMRTSLVSVVMVVTIVGRTRMGRTIAGST